MRRLGGPFRGPRSLFAAALVIALLLSACGSGGGGQATTGAGSGGLTTVRVGLLPISAVAPIYLGMRKGIFARHGLKLEPKVAQSGAAIVPGVVSGDLQFGFANVVSLMVARDKGLPLQIVAQGSQAGPGRSSRFEGVIVKKSSPIRSAGDLAGKTIAVNALDDIGGLLISGALQKEGVDPGSIHYTEIGFPDVNAAVDSGRVDAAYQTEPFLSQARAAGDRVVLYQYPELAKEITIATYFTTEQMAQQHPDTVKRFRDAVNESLDYARTHEAEVRRIVPTYTEIPAAAAEKMILPGWATGLDPATNGLDLVARLATSQHLVDKAPDLGQLVAR